MIYFTEYQRCIKFLSLHICRNLHMLIYFNICVKVLLNIHLKLATIDIFRTWGYIYSCSPANTTIND
jgi:hypothetical protein